MQQLHGLVQDNRVMFFPLFFRREKLNARMAIDRTDGVADTAPFVRVFLCQCRRRLGNLPGPAAGPGTRSLACPPSWCLRTACQRIDGEDRHGRTGTGRGRLSAEVTITFSIDRWSPILSDTITSPCQHHCGVHGRVVAAVLTAATAGGRNLFYLLFQVRTVQADRSRV